MSSGKIYFKNNSDEGFWWHTPLMLALRRQKYMCVCEFEATLHFRRAKTSQRKNCNSIQLEKWLTKIIAVDVTVKEINFDKLTILCEYRSNRNNTKEIYQFMK